MLIYVLTHKESGRKYVGSTVREIRIRIREHKKNPNSLIGRALRKYGYENFSTEIVDAALTIEELRNKEVKWIVKLNCVHPNGFNFNENPGGGLGSKSPNKGIKLGEEWKKAISAGMKSSSLYRNSIKERNLRGERNGNSKVTWSLVREIRLNLSKSLYEFRDETGISYGTLSAIRNNRIWKEDLYVRSSII